jgi:nanoRNase/pAp phosphatase (c-di-AMP/oligoRNAs hydrolase)
MDKYHKIAKEIRQKISESENILIISSRPADQDSIGSNLALGWYIKEQFKKSVESVIFTDPQSSNRLNNFPGLSKVKYQNATEFEFDPYDLIVMVDGAKWGMFLSDSWEAVKDNLDISNVYVIDHHKPQGFQEIEDRLLQHGEACTAKMIYDYFIGNDGLEMDSEVATWLYFALVDDTGRFLHEMRDGTFEFAEKLINAGADHLAATDESMSIDEMNMMVWCIDNTEFVEEIETTILAIDQQKNDELDETFGSNWRYKKLYRAGYTEKVMRRIDGYNYALMFTYIEKYNTVHASWRTRNYGDRIAIVDVLKKIGFDAGGHFGAGGGTHKTKTIEQIVQEFKEEMKNALSTSLN